ncbi:MAG: hypothetical protein IPJ61_20495 [Tessaracoccus sp.]|uniref:hypothetical protein n=1 Tax=Tessaracoccus sp. TaxID=1971211 RepID=UPI001EC45677|nr:hypothetical protein [Tessaracoccus sp.]MBK7823368.1 hypothetical protein [Tessaracoccus sp.]
MFLDMEADDVATFVGATAAQSAAGVEADARTACDYVEDIAGPIEQRTITERVWSNGRYLRLAESPTTVTAVAVQDHPEYVVLVDQLVVGNGGVWGGTYALPGGWLDVTYTVGYAYDPVAEIPVDDRPAWAIGAAKLLTKHNWQARQPQKASNVTVDLQARADKILEPHAKGARP